MLIAGNRFQHAKDAYFEERVASSPGKSDLNEIVNSL